MPFAGVVAGTLGALAFGLFQWLAMKFHGGFSEDGWFFLYILPTITSGIFGYVFVAATYYTAPRGKFITSVVMVTLLTLLMALSIVLTWNGYSQGMADSIRATVGCVVAVVAAILTLIDHYNKDQR